MSTLSPPRTWEARAPAYQIVLRRGYQIVLRRGSREQRASPSRAQNTWLIYNASETQLVLGKAFKNGGQLVGRRQLGLARQLKGDARSAGVAQRRNSDRSDVRARDATRHPIALVCDKVNESICLTARAATPGGMVFTGRKRVPHTYRCKRVTGAQCMMGAYLYTVLLSVLGRL